MTTAVRRRARRRLGVAIVGAFAAGTVLVAGGPAGAVHDENLFELGPTPTPPTNIVGDGVADNGPDWADIFNADGTVNQAALGQFRWRGGVVRSRPALAKRRHGRDDVRRCWGVEQEQRPDQPGRLCRPGLAAEL